MDYEEWKPVVGFEKFYRVSSKGRIMSLHRGQEKILKPNISKQGYLRIEITGGGNKRRAYVHVIVAESFIPKPSNLHQVNHKDGRKANNMLTNLEYVTASENILHSFKELGKRVFGPKNKLIGKNNPSSKIVYSKNIKNGLVVKHDNMRAAAKYANVSASCVTDCI